MTYNYNRLTRAEEVGRDDDDDNNENNIRYVN